MRIEPIDNGAPIDDEGKAQDRQCNVEHPRSQDTVRLQVIVIAILSGVSMIGARKVERGIPIGK